MTNSASNFGPASALDLGFRLMRGAWRVQQANLAAAARTMEWMGNAYARMWGLPGEEVLPADARFKDDAWRENPAFDALRQAYLVAAQWLMDTTDGWKEVDPDLHRRAQFYTRQFVDALSPTNFLLTNPTVMQETLRTGGANLVRGARHFLADVKKGRVS